MKEEDLTGVSVSKIISMCALGIMALVGLILLGSIVENLNADRIMIIQSPVQGKLSYYTTPGWKWQGFGKVTKLWKLDTYEFEIPVRFNDGGHGTIHGSLNYELPFDSEHLNQLYSKYGSQEAIQKQLIETVTNKCVYMTGPLMSSKESYAEKRTDLIHMINDQIEHGVYKTRQKEVRVKDTITGAEKTVTLVEIVLDANGKPERQEEAILASYGIKTSNFAVTELPYDETVENQIKQQQELNMKVQTSIASAKEAEQRAITMAKEGEANAAKAKWEQEVVKAKAVVQAQQTLEVSTLERKAAEQEKMKQILLGEGEGERKRLVMNADGALTQKLSALVEINKMWSDAVAKQKWVPEIIMGSDGKASNIGSDFMSLMMLKSAKDLSLDMTLPNRGGK
jgi:regulator of protease activity HflC (stomatin/prohibitin superfamily)